MVKQTFAGGVMYAMTPHKPDQVQEASEESFPASDAPSFSGGSAGDLAKAHVEHLSGENKFAITVDRQTAVLTYRTSGHTITFLHTGVPPELEGHGIGAKLAHAGLEYARAQKLKVVAQCPFVAGYIKQHPEYNDLVDE